MTPWWGLMDCAFSALPMGHSHPGAGLMGEVICVVIATIAVGFLAATMRRHRHLPTPRSLTLVHFRRIL